ncbi:hypothetical protein K469DRAFT_746117 [Zopfia rhizophila CBS 207.26]|uniref:ABM domain-containing protein n=1 Tax=Zopfia rhizophila CBS 207.26 TaxID=1314779 RepID=A0A6A6ESA2_9PEZI|nr:hypothetical protein K469DRAFT_746117 [Zopfia rhizophila CBS 207.26]
MSNNFYFFANCNFVPGKYSDRQSAYDELAKYVWSSEPTTKTYYFGIPFDYDYDFSNTTSMLAFEAYGASELSLNGQVSRLDISGFSNGTIPLTLRILRLPRLPRQANRIRNNARHKNRLHLYIRTHFPSHLLKNNLASKVEKEEREDGGKGGPLTYIAFKSFDDESGAKFYSRWKTREDIEGFLRREDMIGLWIKSKENVKSVDGTRWIGRGSCILGVGVLGILKRRSGAI